MTEWNLIAELIRREYGFSDRAEIRARNSDLFGRSILGSNYLMEQFEESHTVGTKNSNPDCLNFNANGELLCVSNDDSTISIFDWSHNQLKCCFRPQHTENVTDAKFVNTGWNSLDIISCSNDGQIRRSHISPAGAVTSTQLYYNERGRSTLAAVPRCPNEFVAATTDGRVLLMDLRCASSEWPMKVHVTNGKGIVLPLYSVAHNPFAVEFCIGGCDAFVRVFDRRKLNNGLRELCAEELKDEMIEILQCSYNYDGNEILANYGGCGAFLFRDEAQNSGHYLRSYRSSAEGFDEACFMGPKSEIVICAETEGVYFFNKKTGKTNKFVTCAPFIKDSDDGTVSYHSSQCYICGARAHPFLPVIASKTCKKGVIIWTPAHNRIR